jgi:hypothetical protein
MPPRLASFVLLGSLMGLLAADTRAPVDEPPPALRRLCLDAPAVVLAVPADPMTPLRFRVQEVLRGPLEVGAMISPAGLQADRVRTLDHANLIEGKPRPRRIVAALLFLERDAGKGWRVLPGGLRFCGDDGTTLAPADRRGTLQAREEGRWTAVVARVREDLAAVEQLENYRRIGRPQRRVQALLGWVRQRKGVFAASGSGTDEAPAGWGRLQLEVFDWIFAATGPEDAWQAVQLYAELNHGEAPRLLAPTFATRAGRAFLAKVAGDERRLLGERIRAVQLLTDRRTLEPTREECARGSQFAEKKERESLVEQLAARLPEKDEAYRAALAKGIVGLTRAPGVAGKAVPALVRAYKESLPGPARDELAMALCALAPPSQWKELTGNPPGVCACLRDFDHREDRLTFWLALKTPGPRVLEAPTLLIDRFGALGFIAETKRFPLQVQNLPGGWAAGWGGEDALVAQLDVSKLAGNNHYRARVEGFVGKGPERQKWTSEPRKFRIAPRPNEQQPGRPGMYYK